MFELALMAADVLITLLIVFGANKILWYAVGRRIKITVERKPNLKK